MPLCSPFRPACFATLLIAAACLATSARAQTPFFTPGNVVVAVEGCGVQGGTCTSVPNGSGTGTMNSSSGGYGDNQAAPLTLFQFTPMGTTTATYVNSLVLPQTAVGANFPVSGEYGSSSEGTLQLSGSGQYLTIGAYGINAGTFDASPTTYGAAPSNALAQSGSLTGQSYTPVARIVNLIDAYGNVNSSTGIYNIYNTNNPRSTYSANGTSVYLSGQGSGSDATGGVFYSALYGINNSPTAITGLDTSSKTLSQDTRDVQIVNGSLYVSVDTKGGSNATRDFLGTLGTPPATSLYSSSNGPTEINLANNASTPVAVTSNGKLVLTASEVNSVNTSVPGGTNTINLSPSGYFFANAYTLYIADTGNSKQTSASSTLGDGGLQKWVNTATDGSGTWELQYTLSSGLNLVVNTSGSGTSGLYAVTGTVSGSSVYLYVTNATLSDLDLTYLYGFTDTLSSTTRPTTSFTLLATAPSDSNFKGVALAPTLPNGSATLLSSPSGLTVSTSGTGCVPGTYVTPATLVWTPGSTCQLSVVTPQTSGSLHYVFSKWQDNTTSTTDTVTAPASSATYTATFTNTYQPVGVLEKAADNSTSSTTVQQGDSLVVSGWAADPVDGSPLSNVKVYVDGNLFGTPTLGISRPDVAAAYNNSSYTNSGYQLVQSASSLALGSHAVTVIAIDSSGRSTTFGPLTINVTAASQLAFTSAPAATIMAGGTAGAVQVSLETSSGSVASTSAGTVTLTVSGPNGYAQTYTAAASSGVASFNLASGPALTAAGTYTYTATSPGISSASSAETVTASSATGFSVTGLANQTQPGVAQNFSVTAIDSYGNTASGFAATVTFTSSDPKAMLPGGYSYTSSDAGSHTFSLIFNTAGTLSVTATSGSLTGSETGVVIADAIWVLNASDGLVRLTDAGVQTTTAGSTSGASSAGMLAFDNAGDVWATQMDSNGFVEYSPSGALVSSGSSLAGLSAPSALFIDGSGQAWFANKGNGSVSVVSTAGTAVSPSAGYQPGALATPSGLVIDSSGSIWITNSGANTVTKIIGGAAPVVTPTVTATSQNTLGARP